MPFWTYMLQCSDRRFYVGHTDDLEKRIGQHQLGLVRGYTSDKRPVHLVWSAEFSSRNEARRAELQLKGWGKPKKLALIRGDWAAISALARSQQKKEGASTGSAKSDWEEISGLFLHPHSDSLPSEPFSLEASLHRMSAEVRIRFRLTGPVRSLSVAEAHSPARRDNLWQHTCFEAFVRLASGGYLEFNFSPSTEWAAYRFAAYREGMAELDVVAPRIGVSQTEHLLELKAELALPPDFTPTALGLSAVIEETSGRKSYWALRHPPGDTPDFHHPDCFAIELPPASEP